jgi:hypothetical protein
LPRIISIFLSLLIFLLAENPLAHGMVVYPDRDTAIPKTKTYHFDQVGSTIARTDVSGKVIGRSSYSAYGLTTFSEGDMATPFRYNGQAGVITEPNGLLFMWARDTAAHDNSGNERAGKWLPRLALLRAGQDARITVWSKMLQLRFHKTSCAAV